MESYGNHTDVDGKPLEFHQNKILCFTSRLFGNEIFDIYDAPKDKGKLIYCEAQFCEASNFPFRSKTLALFRFLSFFNVSLNLNEGLLKRFLRHYRDNLM